MRGVSHSRARSAHGRRPPAAGAGASAPAGPGGAAVAPARRRLLLAAAVGAVVLGPALALSLYSLQALSVEQARLADEARAARLHRLRHGGQVTHHRSTTLA